MILVHKDALVAQELEWEIATLVILDTCFIIKDVILAVLLDPIKQEQHVHLAYLIVQFVMILFLVKDVMTKLSTLEYCVQQVV